MSDTVKGGLISNIIASEHCDCCNVGFEKFAFILIFGTRFFLSYFQSYHALLDFFPTHDKKHNLLHPRMLEIFSIMLALLTVVSYLIVRWRRLHEGLRYQPERSQKQNRQVNPYPKIAIFIFILNLIGIIALSAYAVFESINSRGKILLYSFIALSMMGALPTTILFSKRKIERFFADFKKLPKTRSALIAVGTLCMTPLIIVALYSVFSCFVSIDSTWWTCVAWGLSIFIGFGFILGELFINCRIPEKRDTIKTIRIRYANAMTGEKIKLALGFLTAVVFLSGASLVMASGAYVGTLRLLNHLTPTPLNQTISLVLFFITLLVAIGGSYGEDFLGKMVNTILPPQSTQVLEKTELSVYSHSAV